MSWAAYIERVPPNWEDDTDFDDEQGYVPRWPRERCTHWQFWQTKADVTPVSPIFATLNEAAVYAVAHAYEPWFGWGQGLSVNRWRRLLEEEDAWYEKERRERALATAQQLGFIAKKSWWQKIWGAA